MSRTVARKLIDDWIDKNGPNGLLELAKASGVSSSMIAKARTGVVPKKFRTRERLSTALGVSEDVLFPLVAAKGKRAS